MRLGADVAVAAVTLNLGLRSLREWVLYSVAVIAPGYGKDGIEENARTCVCT